MYMQNTSHHLYCYYPDSSHCYLLPRLLQWLPNSSSGLTFVFKEWQSDSLKYESAVTLLPTALQWLPIAELSQHSYEWSIRSSTGETGDHSPLLLLPSMPRKGHLFLTLIKVPHGLVVVLTSRPCILHDLSPHLFLLSLSHSLLAPLAFFLFLRHTVLPLGLWTCRSLCLNHSSPRNLHDLFFSDFWSVTLSARAFLFPDLMPNIK